MTTTIPDTSEKLKAEAAILDQVMTQAGQVIIGQQNVLTRLIIGVLTGGHILLEGVPGLAKTLSIQTLATLGGCSFKRLQFTPDLLPADILGTLIYNPKTHEFEPKLGPIFSQFILADEINRAPAKVQSALLEAMQEKQVTIGDTTYKLPNPFLVLATQNPIEQEGTYPLPEAQVDRFLMKVLVSYPTAEQEAQILTAQTKPTPNLSAILSPEKIAELRQLTTSIYVDERINKYVIDLVFATRFPEKYQLKKLKEYIDFGASPRASISLIQAAKAHAFLNHRGFVTPDDIKAIGRDVMRHRIIPSLQADAENLTTDTLLDEVFSEIEVP